MGAFKRVVALVAGGIDRKIDKMLASLERIERALATTNREIKDMDANTANAIANVTLQINALKEVDAGLGTIIDSVGTAIKDKIDQAVAAAGGNADVVAALTSLGTDVGTAVSDFSAQKTKLAAALVTNTPSATDGTTPAAPATTAA